MALPFVLAQQELFNGLFCSDTKYVYAAGGWQVSNFNELASFREAT